jgi:hypothetical protein
VRLLELIESRGGVLPVDWLELLEASVVEPPAQSKTT